MGGDVLITEPSLTPPLFSSLLVFFSMGSAPSTYSLMKNNNVSDSQKTMRLTAAYHTWAMVTGGRGGKLSSVATVIH